MAKDKEMEFFRSGMERAYKLVKEEGLGALEKEIRFRNITGVNTPLLTKELDKGIVDIKRLTMETILTMTIGVLYSEFGFGRKRLERFRDTFMAATASLNDGIITWADICYNIEDLTGFRANLIDSLGRDTGMIRED